MRFTTPNQTRVRELARDGRRRAETLREALPAALPAVTLEDARHAVEELREQVEPLVDRAVDRALHRRRSRRTPLLRIALGLLATAAIAAVAYILWKRDDEHPAYLMDEPERPDITPAAPLTPTDEAPSGDGPAAPQPAPYREAVGSFG
ncbi:MAG: hypothetical protein AMXMBFR23_07750 [Chloroflexota bacterium]